MPARRSNAVQRVAARFDPVRSALTQAVTVVVGANVNVMRGSQRREAVDCRI
jgi:hypothetical protein